MTTFTAAPPTESTDHRGCRQCGAVDRPGTTLSRHRTSEGTIVYARCPCGTVSVRLEPITRLRVGF
ncbi:hypothetical protein ACFYO1_05775 [Nocardia sp. NPDC006044]|uniref:hypothetical protein n=1 Tax=Nocardia sp. NPDC006044 TaxID=3364306 RepID=UPI0036B16F08